MPSPAAAPSSWFETHWKVSLCAAIGIVIFLALFIFVSLTPVAVSALPASAGAMLAIITASAVGIERTIEVFLVPGRPAR